MPKGPTLKMRKRLFRIVGLFLAACGLFLSCQVMRLSTFAEHDGLKYGQIAANQQMRSVSINANRGNIYDTNMNILAKSYTVYTVCISPIDLKNNGQAESIAEGLSGILEVDKETILEKAKKNNYYEVIKKKVETPQKDEIEQFLTDNNLKGVSCIPDTKRSYPNNNLLSTVIGFTGDDNTGMYGLESMYNSQLQGNNGRVVMLSNAVGTKMPEDYEQYYSAQDGNSLILTVDSTIQYFLESALDEAIETHKVKNRGAAIAIDVNTGAILGMATKPDFNLNEPFTITDAETAEYIESLPQGDEKTEARQAAWDTQWKNKAITELYEPGSVFKIVTGSAAIEEGKATLESTFDDPGFAIVGDRTMKCWKAGGHGHQNLTEVFINSCNPAFIEMGSRLGVNSFFKYLQAYGITEKTGIDLPGEASSLVLSEDAVGSVELASMSFGQTNAITPLQMISAGAAAVNGGTLYTPYIVRQIVDSDGNVVETKESEAKRQVISEETSTIMRDILEQVVSANGGNNAYIPGYRIAGKSGTSEKLGSVDNTERISSFLAFAPADDPQIAVLVILDTPTGGEIYGSAVAAPAVNRIMTNLLPYMGIQPQYTAEELENMEVSISNVVGTSVNEAKNIIENDGLNVDVRGNGDTVVKQVPSAPAAVQKGAKVILYTEENMDEQMTTIPDLIGLSPSEANERLTNYGLNIQINSGTANRDNAKITSQSLPAGEEVPRGTVVSVDILNTDVEDDPIPIT